MRKKSNNLAEYLRMGTKNELSGDKGSSEFRQADFDNRIWNQVDGLYLGSAPQRALLGAVESKARINGSLRR